MTVQAKRFGTLLALALAAGGLTACGVRGPLEPPPEAIAEGQPTKSAESAAAGENSAAKPKPHEPFILDKLLR
ncbi:MAG: lipoprotein [Hyphomicrobium sp.]